MSLRNVRTQDVCVPCRRVHTRAATRAHRRVPARSFHCGREVCVLRMLRVVCVYGPHGQAMVYSFVGLVVRCHVVSRARVVYLPGSWHVRARTGYHV